ncbi:alcohol dehydrogenase family protein [Aestuariispira insulae]|uniref:NADPH:quinone reductase-like Zn-dependent oxidoreductase n=1 Tax=Aestuariispira insulae TaxID=1461337 RepID=A0A3D9HE43_9PROT|nr:alcohol dehydrogenase family protein [Aestuariispira insulae]RED47743.1 NADPH:quinone reductase-like Zn-dependent oxidoreductase [Aestuariispira insulae]
MPDIMKAVLLTGYGGPDKLEYREDVPKPAPGKGEVLIRIGAAGVNNTDLWTREGAYGEPDEEGGASGWQEGGMQFPRIQGLDIAGTIEAVGATVPESRIGKRILVNFVLYHPSEKDPDGLYYSDVVGSECDGGFAEYVTLPSENAKAIQSHYSDIELASFPCASVTAEGMLHRARLNAGEKILITGATGGVGSALVQLAKIRGAEVWAVGSQGKEAPLKELGADHVITRQSGNPDYLLATLAEESIDVAADVVGGDSFPALLKILRRGGRYVTAGAIAGPKVALDLRKLYLKHLELIGSTMGRQADFEAVVRHIETGALKPQVAQTFPLSQIREAQAAFQEKKFFGKLVLVP